MHLPRATLRTAVSDPDCSVVPDSLLWVWRFDFNEAPARLRPVIVRHFRRPGLGRDAEERVRRDEALPRREPQEHRRRRCLALIYSWPVV